MATTSIRWTVTKAIMDILRDSPGLVGCVVEPGWPGDKNIRPEMVWVSDLDGEVNIPVMTAGRKERDDKFDIPLQIRVSGKQSLDDTMTRLVEMVAVVENVFAADPFVALFDGVVDCEVSHERMTCGETPADGRLGFAEVTVSCHSRLL